MKHLIAKYIASEGTAVTFVTIGRSIYSWLRLIDYHTTCVDRTETSCALFVSSSLCIQNERLFDFIGGQMSSTGQAKLTSFRNRQF